MEEEERKARKEAEETFSDEEDYCHGGGGYPEEKVKAVAEDSYLEDSEAEPFPTDNVSTRNGKLLLW